MYGVGTSANGILALRNGTFTEVDILRRAAQMLPIRDQVVRVAARSLYETGRYKY